jgi:FOG: EAL domain
VTLSATNLVILSRCTLDVIKTDRSLVDQITPECPCPAWLSGLSAVLQSTRVAVIAEGVQTEAQAEALRKAGVSMAQGYYFSPPVSAQQLKMYHAGAADTQSRPLGTSDRN